MVQPSFYGTDNSETLVAVVDPARVTPGALDALATSAVLAGAADLLAASTVPVVIDHYGVHGGVAPGSDAGQASLGLMRQPHA